MNYDQFKKADAIVEQLKELYKRKAELTKVSEGRISSFEIACMRMDDGTYPSYKVENLTKMELQPEIVKIFMQAAVLSIASAYDREIKKLEKEFETI